MGSALRWLVAAGLIGALCSGARAQSAAEVYKGRQLQIVVGFEVGNDYNVGAENEQLIAALKKNNTMPDFVGLQSHMHDHVWPMRRAWRNSSSPAAVR